MPSDVEILKALCQAFSAPPLNAAACKTLGAAAASWGVEAQRWTGARDVQLASAVGQLAQQLAEMAQPTADALAAAAAARQDCDVLLEFAHAASHAALGCAAAAWHGQWGQWPEARNDLFRVLTAAKAVLVAGRQCLVVLQAQAAQCRHKGGSGAAAAAAKLHARLVQAAALQLSAMRFLMGKLASPYVSPQLSATFAAAVAPPQLLLAWLAAICHTTLAADEHGMADKDWFNDFVDPLSGLVEYTANAQAFQRHQAELLAPHNLPARRALGCAMLHCLPHLADAVEQRLAAAGCTSASTYSGGSRKSRSGNSGGTEDGSSRNAATVQRTRLASALNMLGNAFGAGVMQQAFEDAAAEPHVYVGGLKAGARIALALPLEAVAGVTDGLLSMAHQTAAICMAISAQSMMVQPRMVALWAHAGSGQPVAAGIEAAGIEAEAAAAEEAGWQALRVLPRLAAVLQHMAATHSDGQTEWVNCLGVHYAAFLQLPHLLGSFSTAEQVAQWATAAEAALRLLPLLLSVDAMSAGQQAGQQQAAGGAEAAGSLPATAAHALGERLLAHVWLEGSDCLARWAAQYAADGQQSDGYTSDEEAHPPEHSSSERSSRSSSEGSSVQTGGGGASVRPPDLPPPPPPELITQLFSLHTTACCLLASLAEQRVAAQRWQMDRWPNIAGGCNAVIAALHYLLSTSDDPVSQRRYAGAHNAHLQALQPFLLAAAALPHGNPVRRSMQAVLVDTAAFAPAAACLLDSEEWMGRFIQALNSLAEDGAMSYEARVQVVGKALDGLDCKPRLAARLVAGGGLAAASQHLLLLALGSEAAEVQSRCAYMLLPDLLFDLLTAADGLMGRRAAHKGAVSEDGSAPQAASGPHHTAAAADEQLEAVVAALEQCLDELPTDDVSADMRLAGIATAYAPAAWAAGDLARMLLKAWAAPEQQAVQQLALAQAAATRSCAYLRCASLGGEGGPFAGQGVGSKRCSACRAVWYCGTACSHADWRAGHKRVCKALAAARQAEKEAVRQQQQS